MYYPSGIVLSFLIDKWCIRVGASHHLCLTVWSVAGFIALLGLLSGLSFREMHRAGKWLWLKLVPSWRLA